MQPRTCGVKRIPNPLDNFLDITPKTLPKSSKEREDPLSQKKHRQDTNGVFSLSFELFGSVFGGLVISVKLSKGFGISQKKT